jgi:EmrB/QacA subfamily drug resistance transporter
MSVRTSASGEAGPRSPQDHRWWILMVVASAQLMLVLDTTIVNVALPSAQADLGIADGQRQWVVTAYALAFGSLLLLGGRVGDLLGRKRTFIGALVVFAIASALGGAAPSFGLLVTARTLQGVAAAMLAPAALSMLLTTFTDDRERGRALGVYSTVAVAGSAVGLVLGGLLTEYLSWRWTMYVNVIFAAAALLGALAFMAADRPASRGRLDVEGAVLASAGLFSLVFGLSHAEGAGWTSGVTITCLVLGVALLVAFAVTERRAAAPLLPPRVVSDRSRATAFGAVVISSFAMFGLNLFLTYYLQTVRGYPPVWSGLAFLPMVGCLIISANVASTAALPRFGPRVVITTGMIVGCLALAFLSQLDVDSTYAGGVLPALIGMGLAMGMIVAPAMNTATTGVEPQDDGVASALFNTMQQVGGSVGTAVLSTIAATATISYVAGHRFLGAGLAAQAATHSYAVAFAVSAGAFAVGAVLTALLFPAKRQAAHARGTATEAACAHLVSFRDRGALPRERGASHDATSPARQASE